MDVGCTQEKKNTNILSYTCLSGWRLRRGHVPGNPSFAWSTWRWEHLTTVTATPDVSHLSSSAFVMFSGWMQACSGHAPSWPEPRWWLV